MVVSDEYKFVFFAVTKTGSGTVQNWLQRFGWRSQGQWEYNHLTPEQAIKHEKIGKRKWKHYKKGCFIRNPWDREVSLFLWKRRHNKKIGKYVWKNFEDFVVNGGDTYFDEYLYARDGNLIMDFVGKFEALGEEMQRMCKVFNIPVLELKQVSHANKHRPGHRRHYSKYYNDKLVDLVYQKNKKVVDEYRYKFGEDGDA